MAAVGPCEMYCLAPSSVVTSIFPLNPIGVPSVIRIKPTISESGNSIRVQLKTRYFQKLPIVCVVFEARAFIIPAMAAMPVAAVMNWNNMTTNICVKYVRPVSPL